MNLHIEKQIIKKLKSNGYVILSNFFSKNKISKMKRELVQAKNKKNSGVLVPRLNKYGKVIYNIQNKCSFIFFSISRSKLLTNVLCSVLNDKFYKQINPKKPNYILRGMIGRNGIGKGLPPHIDSFIPYISDHCFIINITISLDDSLKSNGCLEIVKKSHLSNRYAKTAKNYTPIETKSGDLLIWDSRLWHKTKDNFGMIDRWSVICSFSRWWIKPNFQIWKTLSKQMKKKINNQEKTLLGFRSTIPLDESKKIDLKT